MAARQRLRNRGQLRYSNLGAAVLGQVLARVAGCDFSCPRRQSPVVFAPWRPSRLSWLSPMQRMVVPTPRNSAPPGEHDSTTSPSAKLRDRLRDWSEADIHDLT